MESFSFRTFILIGMVAMFFVMLIGGHKNSIPLKKIIASSVFLTISGVIGVYCMAFVESGYWGGRSFYGAIFLVPVLMHPVARFVKVPYGILLDVCAPAGCVMLSLLKVKCMIDGCCGGRMVSMGGKSFIFPSQKVECAVALVLMCLLLSMVISRRFQNKVYPLFMIIYGAVRFILNTFRTTKPWIFGLPAGNFWSLISLIIGAISLILIIKKDRKNSY